MSDSKDPDLGEKGATGSSSIEQNRDQVERIITQIPANTRQGQRESKVIRDRWEMDDS